MAKKPSVTTLASGFNSTEALNNNFTNIRDQFDNTLSLDGSVPNAMEADLDINNNDLLNVNSATITTLTNTTLTGDSASFNSLTVDGANINAFTAAYKLKLDNIEDNATADQTASEIEALVSHDNLQDFVANEHIDWTTDQGSTNIHAGNYTDTTYSIGNGGLTEVNFTAALNTKLTNIEDNATADQTKADIDALNINADLLDGQHGSYYTTYTDTAISNLVDSAPSTLDTLNELAAALGDDANFSTTVTNSIATKLPLAGGTMTGDISFGNNNKAKFGGTALEIYSDGYTSYIKDNADGNLLVYASSFYLNAANGENLIKALADSAVTLYHNGAAKLDTTSSGVDVTGNITVSGTVDGVDIAARDAVLTSTTTTANAAMPKSGGTFTGDISFEGATANDYETTVTVADPTADRTITLPNASGTVMVQDSSGYVTGGSSSANMILQGSNPNFKLIDTDADASRFDIFNDYQGDDTYIVSVDNNDEKTNSSLLIRVDGDDVTSFNTTGVDVTGRLQVANGSTSSGYIDLLEDSDNGTNKIKLEAPQIIASDKTITLPDETGQVVLSNGAVGTDATALIGRGKIGYCGVDGIISVSHEDQGTSGTNLGFAQSATGYTWINAPTGKHSSLRIDGANVLQAHASEIIANQNIRLDTNKNLVFEGATSNDYETTLTVTDPTADQTITLPNQTGTAMLWQSPWPDDPNNNGNIAIGGYNNLNALTTGSLNTAVGKDALRLATSGQQNTAFGERAAEKLTTGAGNTAIGSAAMLDSQTDNNWTVVGYAAGRGTGVNGTYVGYAAGNLNWANKEYQVAIGYDAMTDCQADYTTSVGAFSMTDGDHYRSTAVGYYALGRSSTSYPYYNTAVGTFSGNEIYSGDGNTTLGYDTDTYTWYTSYSVAVGYQSRTSTYGVSIGYRAGNSLTNNSDDCVVIGKEAGFDLDGGDYCVFIGSQAGREGGTGNYNTSVGATSLKELTSGAYNSALGNSSLIKVTSGEYNSSLGNKAGYNVTTGSNNTFVGHNAGYIQDNYATTALDTGSNVTCLGYEAVPSSTTATNEITLGDNDITSLRCNVQTISSLSDERDKTAIADLRYGLDFINDMRPVEFTWNRRDGSLGAKKDMGFIAQELYDTELDHSSSSRTRLVNWENPEKLEADYVRSYPILVKAVQELSAQVTALEARIKTLEGS